MKKRVEKIISDIKSIKIQGARNIAKSAVLAYSLSPTKETKNKLINVRPTEPMMENILNMLEKGKSYSLIINKIYTSQAKINSYILKLIKNNSIIFTHCHSTSVVQALIYAKRKGKKFEVYNSETRPLYQGRKTAKELKKAKIKVTMFVDLAIGDVLSKGGEIKKADAVFLGADAILKQGVINKIGSGMIAELAFRHKIPVYIIADSWKFTRRKVPIENRKLNEIWNNAPKNIQIKNPAFEFVPKKYIKAVVSELGVLSYNNFLRKVK